MAYKVIILYRLYMPSYFLGTFTEYPYQTVKSSLILYPKLQHIFIKTSRYFSKNRTNIREICTKNY